MPPAPEQRAGGQGSVAAPPAASVAGAGGESMAERPAGVIGIRLDGREVEARQGELIIEAAERAGVFIPRFCYHPRMKPVGMCRMCLVEVSSPRGPSLQPACFVQVADGQEISTASPAARKAQEGVLEFLLVNHPLDCPVCDKGGECPLQDQSMSHGPGETRFIEEKRHWAKPIELGPLTLLDRERCIQCARCTRFAEEIAGEPLIDFFERGDRIEVAVFPDQPFTSYFSGNTVQICPVGALTSVPYRFKSRPWDLEQVETTCTFCSVGCRVAMQSSAGTVVRYLGIDSDPVNQSWLCDRGRYGHEAIGSKDRLREPLVRRNGGLVATTWHEALREAAAGIGRAASEAGGQAVGIIGGARLANEDAYAWSKLARAVIGTDNIDAQLGDGLPAEAVLGLPRATIDQAATAKVVVLLAGDLREELPVLYLRLRNAAAHFGLQLIECAPLPTPLSEVAAASVTYRPGDVGALARALVGPKSHADVPGATADRLGRAHDVLGSALSESPDGEGIVVVLGRTSLTESGAQIAAAAATLNASWPEARFLPALRRGNVLGALDMGLAPGILPGRVRLAAGREWYSEQWGSVPAVEGLDARGILEAAASGELKALVLLGADPLMDFPDRDLATEALETVPFLVAVDTLASSSVQLADVVLPAAGHSERSGTTTNIEGRITRLAQKVVPPGTARTDWIIAVDLAERLGADLGIESIDGIWDEIERVSPLHRGCTGASLASPAAADGIVVPMTATAVALRGIASGARRGGAGGGRGAGGGGGVGAGGAAGAGGGGAGEGYVALRLIDPMATPGIASVEEQGAPLGAGATVAPGETLELGVDDEDDEDDLGMDEDDIVMDVDADEDEDVGSRRAPTWYPLPERLPAPVPDLESDLLPAPVPDLEPDQEPARVPTSAPAAMPAMIGPRDVDADAPESPRPDGYSLRLVTRRTLYDYGTLVQASPSLSALVPRQVLRLRPRQADQLGVRDGDDVKVRSQRGELIVPVLVDPTVPDGVAVLPVAAVPVDEPGLAGLLDSSLTVLEVRVETVR